MTAAFGSLTASGPVINSRIWSDFDQIDEMIKAVLASGSRIRFVVEL